MVNVPTQAEFDALTARVQALEDVIAFLKLTLQALNNTVNPPTP